MIAKTQQEKDQLVLAKENYKKSKENKEAFNSSLNTILTAFSQSVLPEWGSFVFNKQRV